ncbi:MAG: hypothetical protein NPIRA02_40240 [Nitrospirales bacterium]|nr:MAG: hypothetical protein NPIRA02_40240 [Nitrospirales bacterium]
MMTIEAIERSLVYRWSGGEVRLDPGTPTRVEPRLAERILQKCGPRVRIVSTAHIGQWITFQSPLFGVCEGRVVAIEVDAYIVNDHSVLKQRTRIPATWIQAPST